MWLLFAQDEIRAYIEERDAKRAALAASSSAAAPASQVRWAHERRREPLRRILIVSDLFFFPFAIQLPKRLFHHFFRSLTVHQTTTSPIPLPRFTPNVFSVLFLIILRSQSAAASNNNDGDDDDDGSAHLSDEAPEDEGRLRQTRRRPRADTTETYGSHHVAAVARRAHSH